MKTRFEEWNSLSEEEKEAHRVVAKAKNARIKELSSKDWDSLNKEEQEFLFVHVISKREERKVAVRKRSENALKQILTSAPTKLHALNQKITTTEKLFCMDLEFCEKTQVVTEVGVVLYFPKTNEMETFHFIVKEYYDHRNVHTGDNKDNFLFGESKKMSMDEVEGEVLKLVSDTNFLVGHAFANDKGFLTQCGYFKNTQVLDSQSYAKSYFRVQGRMSLERLSGALDLDPQCLHNAGNDAVYTMKSLLKMGGVL